MGILEKNIDAIRPKDPELASTLTVSRAQGVRIERARTGLPTFELDGRCFHSRYDPAKEAALQAADIVKRKPDWVVIFGLGAGHLLKELVNEGFKKVIVYEPSPEILKGVLSEVDLSGVLSLKDVYLSGTYQAAVSNMLNYIEGEEDLLSYQSTPYRLAFPEEILEFINRVHNAHTTNRVAVMTDVDSRLDWVENYFANIGSFAEHPPVDVLRDMLAGVPAVIVGAGPSLMKNIGYLKTLKGRVLIFAAVTASRVLIKHGIVPDLVISAEKIDTGEYFTDVPDEKKIRLVLGEISHPEAFARDASGKFVFFNAFLNLSSAQAPLWGSTYFGPSGGSVTTTALDMALMFGCDPVVFVGQDLAFGKDSTHADGGVYQGQKVTVDEKTGECRVDWDYVTGATGTINCRVLWLKGLDGRPVASKYDWVTFHQWIENYVAAKKKGGLTTRLVNATEGGAYIEGMEHTTLAGAVGPGVEGLDLEKVFAGAEARRTPVDYEALSGSLAGMLDNIRSIRKHSVAIVKEAQWARRALEKNDPGLEKSIVKIRALEGELFDRAAETRFIWETLAAYTHKLKQYLKAERPESERESALSDFKAIAATYKRVGDMSARFVPVVKGAISELERARASAHTGDACAVKAASGS